jgi:hypothetical protein
VAINSNKQVKLNAIEWMMMEGELIMNDDDDGSSYCIDIAIIDEALQGSGLALMTAEGQHLVFLINTVPKGGRQEDACCYGLHRPLEGSQ